MPQGWTEIWLWVAFIGMVIGFVILGIRAISHRHREGMEFSMVSFFVCLWAACMYLSMALGHTITLAGGQEVYWGRYLDWIVTTPLLLLDLGILAGARPKLIGAVIGADIFMIVTGVIASLTTPPENFIWYVISCGAFVALLWALFSEYSATARRRDDKVSKLFSTMRNLLVVLWICYPIVWILGAQGITIIGTAWEAFFYAVLDVTAKVVFGLILTSASATTLAKASNSDRMMRTAESYVQGYQGE